MKQEEIIEYLKNGAVLNVVKVCRKYKGNLFINYYTARPNKVATLDDTQICALFDMDILIEIMYGDENDVIQHFTYNHDKEKN